MKGFEGIDAVEDCRKVEMAIGGMQRRYAAYTSGRLGVRPLK